MAADNGFFGRMTALVGWKGPNRSAVPEDESRPKTGDVFSRSGETFIVPDQYDKQLALNTDTILRTEGAQDLRLYENLLDDDVAFSTFQQRRLAVVSHDWEVIPGDEDDPRSVEAAEHLRLQLKQIPFDRICNNMLFSVWFGYSVGEFVWKVGPDGKIWIDDVIVPDRRWFGFTESGKLIFSPTLSNIGGQEVPANKFWVARTGASHDFAFYGLGLAHWCYWPIWFKRQVIKFWCVYLEKLGFPTVLGGFNTNWNETEKVDFMKTLIGIGRDRAARVPEDQFDKIKVIESSRNAGTTSYQEFVTEQNDAIMRVVLGQTSTSKANPQGLNGNGAEVHADVKAEIIKADADLLSETFVAAKWLTRWNFGDDVAPPRVYRVLEAEEDLDAIAERDVKLDGIGIKRTEESIAEVYGPGYEKAEEPDPVAVPAGMLPGQVPPAAANDDDREQMRNSFAAQDIAPLYVYRRLINARDVLAWARSQGIKNLVPAKELHVTCLYSKAPVDWFELSGGWSWEGGLEVSAGGPRKVEELDEGAVVLRFASAELVWQHKEKIEKGASHDFPEYLPHVTLSYDPQVDLSTVEPYNGKLVFGPEIFEPLETDDIFGALDFSASESDAIDRLAKIMAEETNPILLEFASQLATSLEGIQSAEGMRIALLEAFEKMPAEILAKASGLPMLAERMAAESGLEHKIDLG